MKSNIIIKSLKDNQMEETVNRECDFAQTEKSYIISYLEETYNNIITIDKQTNIVLVEKKSTNKEYYHSKLVFEFQKMKKCAIYMEDYSFFIDINTIKVDTKIDNCKLYIHIKYYINGEYNEVNIEVICDN